MTRKLKSRECCSVERWEERGSLVLLVLYYTGAWKPGKLDAILNWGLVDNDRHVNVVPFIEESGEFPC